MLPDQRLWVVLAITLPKVGAFIALPGRSPRPTPSARRRLAEAARALNPAIEVVVRTHNEEGMRLLEQEQVGKVFRGEHELAHGMAGHVLTRMGCVAAAR